MVTMTIGELARRAGVSTRTLRFWADEGLVPCDRTVAGYRSFGPGALPTVALIRVLRELEVDLATVRSILEGRRDLPAVLAAHAEVIDARTPGQLSDRHGHHRAPSTRWKVKR